jgi:D-3-phosphoglycerate dehydrogenase
VSLHIPLLKQTRHYCDGEFFAAMRVGAILVNTSRGEIVDTDALVAAIREKGIRAGLDVYEDEPAGGSGQFKATELAKLLASCTCHIGGSTTQAGEAVAAETLNVVRTFVRTGEALHCVNLDAKPAADVVAAVRHEGVVPHVMAEVVSVNNESLVEAASQTAMLELKIKNPFESSLQAIAEVFNVAVSST